MSDEILLLEKIKKLAILYQPLNIFRKIYEFVKTQWPMVRDALNQQLKRLNS